MKVKLKTDKLKSCMVQRAWGAKALAKESGVSMQTILKIFREPDVVVRVETAGAIAHALELEPLDLVDMD